MKKDKKITAKKKDTLKELGSAKALVNLMVKDGGDSKWVTNELEREGPKHKRILTVLLLKRLNTLVKALEKKNAAEFTLYKGILIPVEDSEKSFPISFPIAIGSSKEKEKIARAIAHAPGHEILAYAVCLQAVEWAIKTTGK